MMCEACTRGDHANCGMQSWCECENDGDGDLDSIHHDDGIGPPCCGHCGAELTLYLGCPNGCDQD